MRILALDLATRTGFAVWDGTRRESGFVDFDVKRGESPGMRFVRFNRWLDDIGLTRDHNLKTFDLFVFEQAHHRGGAATEIAAGFSTRVLEFCALHGIEHGTVHTATLKKWTTGRGNAKKPEMVAAVQRRFMPEVESLVGVPMLDDNEADAIALLEYARAEIVGAEGQDGPMPRSRDSRAASRTSIV